MSSLGTQPTLAFPVRKMTQAQSKRLDSLCRVSPRKRSSSLATPDTLCFVSPPKVNKFLVIPRSCSMLRSQPSKVMTPDIDDLRITRSTPRKRGDTVNSFDQMSTPRSRQSRCRTKEDAVYETPRKEPVSLTEEVQNTPKTPKNNNAMKKLIESCETPSTMIKNLTIFYASPASQKRDTNSSPGCKILQESSPCKKKMSLNIKPAESPVKLTNILIANLENSPVKENIPSPIRALPRKRPSFCLSPLKSSVSNCDVIKTKSPKMLVSPLRLHKQEGKCYQETKKVLHTSIPDRLICREKETNQIERFLADHLVKKRPGSLYVSGAPGTGKTAVLTHTLTAIKEKMQCKRIYINCMSVKSSAAIYNKVASEMKGTEYNRSTKEAVGYLKTSFTTQGSMVLMVLDEIDQLDSKHQEVLYTMFEWPALNKSRLVLIGIANALDLTDRILPRLQAIPKCKPQLLNFRPYTKEQIVTILTNRLQQVSNETAVLDPMAIQFCARKVSAVAGDIRKALDVCRRAVEVVEAEVRSQQILKTNTSSNSPRKVSGPMVRKVSILQIDNVIQEVYGNRVTTSSKHQSNIPLQQKIAVCTLLLMLKVGKIKEVLLGKFHDTFIKIGRSQQIIENIDQGEFLSLCQMIESRGIISLKKSKETRMTKVTLKLNENEVEHALQDKLLMTSILYEGIP